MLTGLVFVTARDVDLKTINQFLLQVRQYHHDESLDSYRIVYTVDELKGIDLDEVDEPPLQSFTGNEYEGLALEAVESILFTEERAGSLFHVLDDEGVRNRTIILVERDDEKGRYDKMRVPWQDVSSIFVNLAIGNMNFQEFTEQFREQDYNPPGGWWTYRRIGRGDSDEVAAMRADEVKELEELDLA